MDVFKKNRIVGEVVELLCSRCGTPSEMLEILVPVVAAALDRVKVEPEHIPQFFFRVTALLDQADRKRTS